MKWHKVYLRKMTEEELEEIANDYFFECDGIYKADYLNFEFEVYKEVKIDE